MLIVSVNPRYEHSTLLNTLLVVEMILLFTVLYSNDKDAYAYRTGFLVLIVRY